MARNAIRRDLHNKDVDHTKEYSVVDQHGKLRIVSSSEPAEKVSKASEPKKVSVEPEELKPLEKETDALDNLKIEVEEEEAKPKPKAKKTSSKKKSSKKKARSKKKAKAKAKKDDQ